MKTNSPASWGLRPRRLLRALRALRPRLRRSRPATPAGFARHPERRRGLRPPEYRYPEKEGAFCDFDQLRLTRQKEEVGRAELLWGHSALVEGFTGVALGAGGPRSPDAPAAILEVFAGG